jgi:hypothetical protein
MMIAFVVARAAPGDWTVPGAAAAVVVSSRWLGLFARAGLVRSVRAYAR